MSRLIMSVVSLAMGLEVQQKCESCSDGGGNSNNNNMVRRLFFLSNPFLNINKSLNPRMITISDRLFPENDASDRK